MRLFLSLCLCGLLADVAPAQGQGPIAQAARQAALEPGDPAPRFTLRGSDGRIYSLSDFVGVRPVVIAWFPRVFASL